MIYYLLLTEGKSEQAFVNILIESNAFSIPLELMIDRKVHHRRKIDQDLITLIKMTNIDDKVRVIKFCDKNTDGIKIPKDLEHKIENVTICRTHPEFEILIIISVGLYEQFQKEKSTYKAKQFVKRNIIPKYNGSEQHIRQHFLQRDPVLAVFEYSKLCNISKNEITLYDLLEGPLKKLKK